MLFDSVYLSILLKEAYWLHAKLYRNIFQYIYLLVSWLRGLNHKLVECNIHHCIIPGSH